MYRLITSLYLLTLVGNTSIASAGGCVRVFDGLSSSSLNGIRLLGDTSPALDRAASQWNFCGGMIPTIFSNQTPSFPTAPVTVHLLPNSIPTSCGGPELCGCAHMEYDRGVLIEAEVWAFENSTNR